MKKATLDRLTDSQLQLVLTYAPAGLGHLRITDSLYEGLPKSLNPILLGSRDRSIQTIHRITSIHPIARAVFEWLQSGPLAFPANRLYRFILRMNTGVIYDEFSRLVDEPYEPPRKILVISTHFGLAHKLAAIKKKLEREKGVRIVLVVFVSDDTFQHIWHVDGADLLVVASRYIKRKYAAYGRLTGRPVRVEVNPYPLNPRLGKRLTSKQMAEKTRQLDAVARELIQVSIPISGAAVGTEYFDRLIAGLREKSTRFIFHVVSKDAPFTKRFLAKIDGKPWIDLLVGRRDREVVDLYDELMDSRVVSLEVTKPSEQAFKALLGTRSRGGVILLFSQPVGRQEFDNLDFLERHALVPAKQINLDLWEMAGSGVRMDPGLKKILFEESRTWKGVRIPNDARQAADFIWWMLEAGIFARMLAGNLNLRIRDGRSDVLGPNGVAEFWDLAASV
jgi:hypothetical protein